MIDTVKRATRMAASLRLLSSLTKYSDKYLIMKIEKSVKISAHTAIRAIEKKWQPTEDLRADLVNAYHSERAV